MNAGASHSGERAICSRSDPVPDVRHGRSDIPHMVGDIVSRLLRKFEIVSATKLRGSESFKGYHHAQFAEAFARDLEPQNVTASHTA